MQIDPINSIKSFRLHWPRLTRNDTLVLKGVGITLIVLHNFFHSFPRWGLENEFAFSTSKFQYVRTHLSGNLYHTIGLVLAYFGHYGVQLFVFLSAYGLYLSYNNKPLQYGKFIRARIWKLWPAFFLAVLFLIALTIITTRSFNHTDLYLGSLLRLTFLSNLLPGNSFDIVGPWWFYSMIVQFYLLFPLLRKWFDRYGVLPLVLLSILSWIVQILYTTKLNALGWTLNTLVIGHLPVFCLGLMMAKYKLWTMPFSIFLLACILFYLGNLNKVAWVFSQFCVTLIFLYTYVFLKKITHSNLGLLRKPLFFIGNLSMYLFAVNGFLRHPFIQQVTRHPNLTVKCAIIVGFLLFVTLMALVLRLSEKLFLKFFCTNAPIQSNNDTIKVRGFQSVVCQYYGIMVYFFY